MAQMSPHVCAWLSSAKIGPLRDVLADCRGAILYHRLSAWKASHSASQKCCSAVRLLLARRVTWCDAA